VPAAHVLFVLRAVALAAVRGRHGLVDDETPVLQLVLSLNRLMTVQARHPSFVVPAHLEFVDDCRSLLPMTFSALSRGTRERRGRMDQFDIWPPRMQQNCRHDER
jgi:hypothetical protein